MIFQLKNISFKFSKIRYRMECNNSFLAQDHFGLDVTDIKNKTYSKIDFFAYGSFYNGIKTLLSNLFHQF